MVLSIMKNLYVLDSHTGTLLHAEKIPPVETFGTTTIRNGLLTRRMGSTSR